MATFDQTILIIIYFCLAIILFILSTDLRNFPILLYILHLNGLFSLDCELKLLYSLLATFILSFYSPSISKQSGFAEVKEKIVKCLSLAGQEGLRVISHFREGEGKG